ncbi:MAG: hypothetical protein R6W96_09580 [Clostridia bacterium]
MVFEQSVTGRQHIRKGEPVKRFAWSIVFSLIYVVLVFLIIRQIFFMSSPMAMNVVLSALALVTLPFVVCIQAYRAREFIRGKKKQKSGG